MNQPTPARAPGVRAAEAALLGTLDAWGQSVQTARTLRWLLLVAAVALVLPLLSIIADHLIAGGLSAPLRWALLGTWTIAVAGGALVVGVARRRRIARRFAAQQIERERRIRHNLVINALELRHRPAEAHAWPAVLRQANARLAGDQAVASPTERAPSAAMLILALVIAAWLGYAGLAPKPVGPSLARLLGADLPPPTATQITQTRPGPCDAVHAGDALSLEFAFRGRRASHADLAVCHVESVGPPRGKTTPFAQQTIDLPWDDPRGATAALALSPHEVRPDLAYLVRAGDATLAGRIRVLPQPQIESLQITLTPPAHTGAPPETTPARDLLVWPGTLAEFRLRANVPIADPVLVLRGDGEGRTRMPTEAADAHVATVRLTLREAGEYSVLFADRTGYSLRNPPRYRIELREWSPPASQPDDPSPSRGSGPPDRSVTGAESADLAGGASQQSAESPRGSADATQPQRQTESTGDAGESGAADAGTSPDGTADQPAGTEPAPRGEAAAPSGASSDRPADPGEAETENGVRRSAAEEVLRRFADEHREALRELRDARRARPSATRGQAAGESSGAPAAPAEGAAQGPETAGGEERDPNAAESPGSSQPDTKQDGGSAEPPAAEDASDARGDDGGGEHGATPDQLSKPGDPRGERAPTGADAPAADLPEANSEQGGDAPEHAASGQQPGSGEATSDGSEPAAGPEARPTETSGPPPGASPDDGAIDDSTGRVEQRDLLELLRRGEIDPETADQLGWSAQRRTEFTRALERLRRELTLAGGSDVLAHLHFDPELGDSELQIGRGVSADVGESVGDAASGRAALANFAPPREDEIPPEWRAFLEAYYRSVAQTGGRERE